MRADGSKARQITKDGYDVEPVFSPDGSHIAFGRLFGANFEGEWLEAVWVVNADGTDPHELVAPRPGLEHPDWSSDNRWISFNIAPEATNAPGSGSIMVLHPNGRGLRTLRPADDKLRFFKAVWSPDGRRLLTGCHDVEAGIDKLCTLDAHTRRVTVIVDATPDPVNFPSWGPRPHP